MKTTTPKPGRPRTNPLPRAEQLRRAKRAQRERDRDAGLVLCQLKLGKGTAERLRHAIAIPGFEAELADFLEEEIVDVCDHPNLRLLCWNRAGRFITGRDAFGLYERNWRLVDRARLGERERGLIERLAARYGNGLLNV